MLRLLASAVLLLGASLQDGPRLTAPEFARRRAALAERLPGGAIALDAGPLKGIDGGGNGPMFDFKYMAGFHEPDAILVIAGGKSVVFLGDPSKAAPGFDAALELGKFPEWAAANLPRAGKIHTKLRQKNIEVLKAAAPGLQVVGGVLGPELTAMRLVKSEIEIRLMTKAADATNKAHVAAMKALKPGMNEREIQAIIEGTFKKEGCPELGFPSICAAGRNGTVLHYTKNDQEIPRETLMVCDIGAAIENYVTDITRTLPTSGKFSPEQRRHYQCVLDAQKAAEAVLKPGASFQDLSRAARKVFEDRGLTKWSYAHSPEGPTHSLGHYVGMYVHDSGTYREKFKPGMVITIEPGWYDGDAGYGIRIEDVYRVVEGGFERLSAGAPREIDEIEKLMSGRKF